jgi:hypothetical protein
LWVNVELAPEATSHSKRDIRNLNKTCHFIIHSTPVPAIGLPRLLNWLWRLSLRVPYQAVNFIGEA